MAESQRTYVTGYDVNEGASACKKMCSIIRIWLGNDVKQHEPASACKNMLMDHTYVIGYDVKRNEADYDFKKMCILIGSHHIRVVALDTNQPFVQMKRLI